MKKIGTSLVLPCCAATVWWFVALFNRSTAGLPAAFFRNSIGIFVLAPLFLISQQPFSTLLLNPAVITRYVTPIQVEKTLLRILLVRCALFLGYVYLLLLVDFRGAAFLPLFQGFCLQFGVLLLLSQLSSLCALLGMRNAVFPVVVLIGGDYLISALCAIGTPVRQWLEGSCLLGGFFDGILLVCGNLFLMLCCVLRIDRRDWLDEELSEVEHA